nr:4'-phosphopantetheinyl transferase superfamily protein [Xylocopilactobacillus apis]
MSSLKRQVEFLGGRFSVKESYTKALGTGLGSIGFQDIAVLDDTNGKPFFLYQPFQGKSYVSISHTNELVFTEVILEAENEI